MDTSPHQSYHSLQRVVLFLNQKFVNRKNFFFFCIFSVDQIFDRLLWVQETSLFFPALQHHGAPPPSFTIHTSTVDGGFTCLLRYKSISSHKICRAHQELCSVRKGAAQARGPQLYLALCCWYELLV